MSRPVGRLWVGLQRATDRNEHRGTDESPGLAPLRHSVRANLVARNGTDADVTLTVALRRDGDRVAEQTETIEANGESRLLSRSLPRDYTVEACLGSRAGATYDWEIQAGYEGRLEVQITGPERVTFREEQSGPFCPDAATNGDLPYSIPGADESFKHGSLEIRNDSERTVTLSVSIAHDGTTFFDCTRDLEDGQSASHGSVTASAGTYAVTAEVADGDRTENAWRVPTDYNWPKLVVVVGEDGAPLSGCGDQSRTIITIENPRDEAQSVDLTLLRGEDPVDEGSITVDPDSESEHALSFPIGEFYTLRAATDAGTRAETLPYCYCYDQASPTVTLSSDGPEIDPYTLACE